MLTTTESDRYIELLQQFPPRPIRSEQELLAVQDVMDRLIDADQMTLEQRDYLDVLGTPLEEIRQEYREWKYGGQPEFQRVYAIVKLRE